MAPILDDAPQLFVLEDFIEMHRENSREEEDDDNKVSIWVKTGDIIRASIDEEKFEKLEPGVYTVDYSRDAGLYIKQMDVKSDELFVFSDSITTKLMEEINMFWDKADRYKENKLIHKRGILLEGYPGTGKSSIISILSKEIMNRGGVVFKITGSRNLDHYVEFLRTCFRKVQPDTPVITILEDLDQYEDVEMELLDFLDGKTHLDHHVVIATTNNTQVIPDTFLRPSRIDLKIEVPLPCETTRKEYFEHKNVPSADIAELVEKSNEFSLADLKELYISIYLLDYSVDEAVAKITVPRDKKSYMESPIHKAVLGI